MRSDVWGEPRQIPYDEVSPFPIKPTSGIVRWRDWPDDVREVLLRFNQKGCGQWRLSFYGTRRVFKCAGCREFCRAGMVGHVYKTRRECALFCDDCLITAARRSLLAALVVDPREEQP